MHPPLQCLRVELAARRAADVPFEGKDKVPAVGDEAPKTHTPTREDVLGDLQQLDMRRPFDTMHDVDARPAGAPPSPRGCRKKGWAADRVAA
ncbi:MAG: hypothetical protein H0T69_03230 [Thermoleophilaceae bacterium]|nr:hypothetical protein [Thermoleophilaceae bacterium]